MASRPKILLTNDDGIDSVGLHILARSMQELGDVTIVAPDSEYSGASAAIGAIWEIKPEVHEAHVEGIDTSWTVSGPPALCVMFAAMGAFGFKPDLIVSGINPGANVGRAVYHSGTVGACLTGRVRGITGVAVSQKVDAFGVEGQAWEETIKGLLWQSAADVAAAAVSGLLETPLSEPGVLNINVPNLPTSELNKWRWTEVGSQPLRSWSSATLEPKEGHVGSYHVKTEYGGDVAHPDNTDSGAVLNNEVALTWLSPMAALYNEMTAAGSKSVDGAMGSLLG